MTSSPWPPSSSSFSTVPLWVSSLSCVLIHSSPLILGQSSLGVATATPTPTPTNVIIDTKINVGRNMSVNVPGMTRGEAEDRAATLNREHPDRGIYRWIARADNGEWQVARI